MNRGRPRRGNWLMAGDLLGFVQPSLFQNVHQCCKYTSKHTIHSILFSFQNPDVI